MKDSFRLLMRRLTCGTSVVSKDSPFQGWNKEEDCPVTAGEEHLDAALQPYQKDLAMEIMFDLSGMETGPTMDDALGNEDEWPSKDALMDESNAVNTAQEQNDDGFLGISKAQLGFYDKKGVLKTPKISELQ